MPGVLDGEEVLPAAAAVVLAEHVPAELERVIRHFFRPRIRPHPYLDAKRLRAVEQGLTIVRFIA